MEPILFRAARAGLRCGNARHREAVEAGTRERRARERCLLPLTCLARIGTWLGFFEALPVSCHGDVGASQADFVIRFVELDPDGDASEPYRDGRGRERSRERIENDVPGGSDDGRKIFVLVRLEAHAVEIPGVSGHLERVVGVRQILRGTDGSVVVNFPDA